MTPYTWTRHGALRAAERWPHLTLDAILTALASAILLARKRGQAFLGVVLPGEEALAIFIVEGGSIVTGYGHRQADDAACPLSE
jgi:hypothetical protein